MQKPRCRIVFRHKKMGALRLPNPANLHSVGPVLLKNLNSTAMRRETNMNRIKVGLEAESLKPDA